MRARTAGEGVRWSTSPRFPAVTPGISASWSAKLAFDRFPRLAFTIARTPPAWRLAERLLRDELPNPREVSGTMRVPLQALRALAHAAQRPGHAAAAP